ncbi:MAG: hypothetical protein FWD78_04795 [Treponema sp.]|nr:hypothetical protein [Treponema sp.]
MNEEKLNGEKLNMKKQLTVNSGLACLLKDRQGILDNYDRVMINCGSAIVSAEINAKLTARGGSINAGSLQIKDIKGEIIQLDKGAVIDGNSNLKDLFVISMDRILVTKEGMMKLGEAEGLIVLGAVYYPETGDMACLAKVSGEKYAYPDDAEVILGDRTLEDLITGPKTEKKHIWISGRLTALDKKALETASSRGLRISCQKLFTYEGLNEQYADLIDCPKRTLVPDGYEIAGKIGPGDLPLYGSKIYVDGKFSMEEKDIPALQEIGSIMVKGKATLPAAAVKIFRNKGKADEYFVYEGRLAEVNGFEQLSHAMLDAAVKSGEKITYLVNGCLLFDNDVIAQDMECIASVSYNGSILIPAGAKAALASKVKKGSGFMGDPEKISELTGLSIKELIGKATGESGDSTFNMGTYILA